MIDSALMFLYDHWLKLAIAYGIVYITYVFYYLYSIRFKEVRRVTSRDFSEACGEAVFGPIAMPCRMAADALRSVKASVLAMVNIGLPKEEPAKGSDRAVI